MIHITSLIRFSQKLYKKNGSTILKGYVMDLQVQFSGGQKVDVVFDKFTVKTDQPVSSGGTETAPDPFSLFLSSIAACTGIYVLRFCQQRKISTDDMKISMNTDWNNEKKLMENINISIETGDNFPEKYRDAVIHVAKLCTVKRHLEHPPNININVT